MIVNMMVIETLKDSLNQVLTLNLPVGKATKRVRLSLIYQEKTDRWYMSMTDVQTDDVYFSNIPLLASEVVGNNLLNPYWYKRIGLIFCYPKSQTPSTPDPSKDNLDEFYIIWSDGIE